MRTHDAQIVVVDDEPANLALMEAVLQKGGFTNVLMTGESEEVVSLCARHPPDLLLLDLHMPAPDGFEVLELLRPWIEGRWFPILVLTADVTPEAKYRALSMGAKDFLTKPLDPTEVLLRIENLLEVRVLQLELRKANLQLEQEVRERTTQLDKARFEMFNRLALAAEFRDDLTGEHSQRIGRTSAALMVAMGFAEGEVETIRHAAPLHDIGKIGIPDGILLKQGPLTVEEREIIRTHVRIGREMLSGSSSPVLQMAERIAWTHHEWWDGNGYPSGASGTDIPISGRIVAVADVFDVLTHERPYKLSFPMEDALEEIRAGSGSQFDPEVVRAFEGLDHGSLLEHVGADHSHHPPVAV